MLAGKNKTKELERQDQVTTTMFQRTLSATASKRAIACGEFKAEKPPTAREMN